MQIIYCNFHRVEKFILYGPYKRKQDNRRIVILKSGELRITKLYAKVKLEIKLGRILGYNETVDHIDDDVTNDRFSNLQLLTRKLNASKSAFKAVVKSYPCVW